MPRRIGEPEEPGSGQEEVELTAEEKEELEKYKSLLEQLDVDVLLGQFAKHSEMLKFSREEFERGNAAFADGGKTHERKTQMIIDEVTRRIDKGKTAE